MTFARFMELALYHRTGYYRRPQRPRRLRAGHGFSRRYQRPGFGELIAAACVDSAAPTRGNSRSWRLARNPPRRSSGAVGGVLAVSPILRPGPHSRRGQVSRSWWQLHRVFGTELFDAQPFHRFVFRRGGVAR